MFTVGEFSRLAQVSKRLLRYYDEIGLLKPVQIDQTNGYRYYSAEQMAQLNRILALKELGLTLDQIQRILRDNISVEEIQGMLMLKKAEIEQQLEAELKRIRSIESRLQSIRNTENKNPVNIVLKEIPAQTALGVRLTATDFEHAIHLFKQIADRVPKKTPYDLCYCICHSDGLVESEMDLEMGRIVQKGYQDNMVMSDDFVLQAKELPAFELAATLVVKGAIENIHIGYTQIGQWIADHHYRCAGIPREITLQFPQEPDGSDLVTEIQFPVEPISQTSLLNMDDYQSV